jgi:20S proteasome alpha/beta subunit
MTLQIALVGTDGIVLASDKRATKVVEKRESYLERKIFVDVSSHTASCWSGDRSPARDVAQELLVRLSARELETPDQTFLKELI